MDAEGLTRLRYSRKVLPMTNQCTDGTPNHRWNSEDMCKVCGMSIDTYMAATKPPAPREKMVGVGPTPMQREIAAEQSARSRRYRNSRG